MRRRAAWLVTLPLALAGVEGAHAVANSAVGGPEGSGELFASAGSGAELLVPFAVLFAGLVLIGLAAHVAGIAPRVAGTSAVARWIALLPPACFVAVESLEGVLSSGAMPWEELVEPAFFVGLALQLPFALAAYLLARLLLRAGDAVARLLGLAVARRRRAARARAARPPAAVARAPRWTRQASWSGRAPPAVGPVAVAL